MYAISANLAASLAMVLKREYDRMQHQVEELKPLKRDPAVHRISCGKCGKKLHLGVWVDDSDMVVLITCEECELEIWTEGVQIEFDID